MTNVIPLHQTHIQSTGEMIARAFFDDPLSIYTWPNPQTRLKPLTHQSVGMMRYGELYGASFTTSDLAGAIVWLKPNENDFSFWRLVRSGLIFSSFYYGREAFQRMMDIVGYAGERHDQVIKEPHWYLMQLGVEPTKQKQGVGQALVLPMLAHADKERRPCYLETMLESNLPFYQKLGFKVVADGKPFAAAPNTWFLIRQPQ